MAKALELVVDSAPPGFVILVDGKGLKGGKEKKLLRTPYKVTFTGGTKRKIGIEGWDGDARKARQVEVPLPWSLPQRDALKKSSVVAGLKEALGKPPTLTFKASGLAVAPKTPAAALAAINEEAAASSTMPEGVADADDTAEIGVGGGTAAGGVGGRTKLLIGAGVVIVGGIAVALLVKRRAAVPAL